MPCVEIHFPKVNHVNSRTKRAKERDTVLPVLLFKLGVDIYLQCWQKGRQIEKHGDTIFYNQLSYDIQYLLTVYLTAFTAVKKLSSILSNT